MLIPIVFRRVLPLCAALLAGVATSVVLPPVALAAKTAKVPIAVGSFAGPQQTKIRAKVMEVLRKSGSYEVTDAEDIKPGATTAAYAGMAKGMGANALIVGVISKRFNLTLTVYGGNGARIDTIEVKGGGSFALLKKIDNELEITIADPIARAKPSGGAPAAAPAEAAPAAAAPKGEKPPKGGKGAAPTKAAPKAGEEEEPELGEDGEIEEAAPAAAGEEEDAGGAAAGGDAGGSTDIEAPSEPSQPGLRPLELIAGLRGYNRSFKYTNVRPDTDTDHTQLHPYSLPLGPALIVALRFYPAALFRDDAWSHIGLTARYEFGIATATQFKQKLPNGTTQTTDLSTSSASWEVGLRGRLPLGPHELGMFAEYGSHSFILKGDELYAPPKPYALVPDTKYAYLRTGLDAQLHFGKVVLGGHFAPRFMQSVHEIDLPGVWFPGATGSGVDAGLMGGYGLLPFLSVVAGVDALRYGFDFNGIPDCKFEPKRCVVAGGATDTYISGWLGVMLHLDGSAAAAAAAK